MAMGILTCHNKKSIGMNNNINDAAVLWYCACWLTVMGQMNRRERVIMMAKNVCCEKRPIG